MSAMEKHVVQIFERKKRIIDQARQQCHLWEHHLFPKLVLDGILPPPWLCNDALHSLASDPKELKKDDIVSEVLLSQQHFKVPFPGHHCSLYSNLDVVSDDVQFPIGLHNKCYASEKGGNADGLSNLPDCLVNDAGCASSGPLELDSVVDSPQNQIETRVSDSYHDPAVSLAKLQRSKSRQRALELRNSAEASKHRSEDDSAARVCAGAVTGSPSPTLQADHIMESDIVKDSQCNNQSSSREEVRIGDCQTLTDNNSKYSGRITRSKSLSQKFNSSKVAGSSSAKEDGSLPNNLNESLELVSRPSLMNGSCGLREANKGEYQSMEVGSSVYDKISTKAGSTSLARYDNELKSDCTLGGRNEVEVCDFVQPCTNFQLADLSKASDCNSGRGKNTVEDGNFHHNRQEHGSIRLHTSACPSSGNEVLMTSGSIKSIDKSEQSSQHLISQNSHHHALSAVESFGGQKDPDFCAVTTNENLGRSDRGEGYASRDSKSLNHAEDILKSLSSKSQNAQPAELDSRKLSSSPKHSKLDIETAMNSAENGTLAAHRNTGAETSCTNNGPLRPVSSSNFDGRSLHAESSCIEIAVAENVFNAQETTLPGANPVDNVVHSSAANIAKDDTDFHGLIENDPSCLGSKHTSVIPEAGPNDSGMRLPTDFAMSVMPKQLDFDDVEETNMDGISSPDKKEGQQGMSAGEKPLNLFKPVNLLSEETSIVCQGERNSLGEMHSLERKEVPTREVESHMEHGASHLKEPDIAGKALNASSANKELTMVQHELSNNLSPSQVVGINSSGGLSKEVFSSKFISVNRELINDEHSTHLADSFPAALTTNCLHIYTDGNSGLALGQEASNSISLCQNGDLLRQAMLNDGKITGFSAEGFTHDVERSCFQHKRRKIEINSDKSQSSCLSFFEKPLDSIDQKAVRSNSNIEEGKSKDVIEVQHLASDPEVDLGHEYVSNSPLDEVQYAGECQTMDGSSLQVRNKEKLILDGRDRISDSVLLAEPNLSSFSVDSPGIPCLDLIGTGEALPEFEGFIMQTDNTQPSSAGDQMELEKMDLSGNSIDYSSLGKSRFIHSPLCYSSTPYKLHKIPDLYKSLPNGLLEGMGTRTSFPPNSGSSRSLSDCLPNYKSQPSSIQTLWDRINSNFGSSGKRKSLKLELPCISEENENVDEIASTFQTGVDSEGIADSISRKPLKEIIDNAKTSTSVLQEDVYTGGCEDSVTTELNFTGTRNKIKKKLPQPDGNSRRFTSKGKENHNISLGANGVKRTAESVRKRPSRPKLSGKISMKHGPNNSEVKSKRSNIVSNVTSFIPLVQQKQAAAAVTGKRDVKVKALEAAEAAKRMAEKKENERKMKKEALRLERERMERQNLKQKELEKKKKEEERKKKEAEMAAKKRQREDEDKKEKERKRKRLNDAKKQQQEHEKIHAKKEATQIQCQDIDEEVHENSKLMDGQENHKKIQLHDKTEDEKISEAEPLIKATDHDLIIRNSPEEQSYDMSPYKGSDDEDEDEDDLPNKKFIPSWASKHRLSLVVSSQNMDPKIIFPPNSFCNIAEVLLPRKLQMQ